MWARGPNAGNPRAGAPALSMMRRYEKTLLIL
jgi:hypothetical protein